MRRIQFIGLPRTVPRAAVVLLLVIMFLTAVVPACAPPVVHPVWMNLLLTPDQRADALIQQQTLDEKIALLHGVTGSAYVGFIPANRRLGIPALKLEDGPAGVADGMRRVTAFPAPVVGAASWDSELMYHYGQMLGSEERDKGVNVVLAPTVNILRIPQWGRSFESLGEDPYLTAQLGVADIRGIQSQGVIATIKHYTANNQEFDRTTVSGNVDERTLHEIYLPAFEAAVRQAQVGAVMCAYNRVNAIFSCEQPYVLNQVLKQSWGFQGFVLSDWGATHSAAPAANAGLDMQMPDDTYFGPRLKSAVQHSQVSITTINTMVHRILRTMFALGLFDHPPSATPGSPFNIPAHARFARQAAEEGTVLLKNNGDLLPIKTARVKSIAVIGPDALTSPKAVGGGSAGVVPPYVVAPLQGITRRAGSGIAVRYAAGMSPSGSDPGESARLLNQAAQLAKQSDLAIVFVNDEETEGADRKSLGLPGNQDQLIQAVAGANPHSVVVLNSGGPVLMPWVDQVAAIVEAWYPGQEDGNAAAAVLFGDSNPSGKLPMSFPKAPGDVPASTQAQYPGLSDQAQYTEGVFVGYRHFDRESIIPLFPFGYGLSYTTFAFSDLHISPTIATSQSQIAISVLVTNTGLRAGAEVLQIYIGEPSTNGAEPPRQLEGFHRVVLQPGQTQQVYFTLNPRAFSFWDMRSHRWVVQQGAYQIMVGDASRNLPLQGSFAVNQSNSQLENNNFTAKAG